VSPEGFRVVTRGNLAKGGRITFSLSMDDGRAVEGEAEVIWVREDGYGGCEAGVRVTNMSWSDARRLRGVVYEPGFDFAGLAWTAAKMIFLLVVVAGLQNILFHQPHVRAALLQMAPVLVIALLVLVVVHAMFKG
jgi:hypothetical protein